MSSFDCERCGACCLDTEEGYVTGCTHYPPEAEISDKDLKYLREKIERGTDAVMDFFLKEGEIRSFGTYPKD